MHYLAVKENYDYTLLSNGSEKNLHTLNIVCMYVCVYSLICKYWLN